MYFRISECVKFINNFAFFDNYRANFSDFTTLRRQTGRLDVEHTVLGVKVSLKKIFKIVAIQHPRRIVDKIVLYAVNDLHSDLLRLIHRKRERLNVAVIGDRHCLVTPIVRAAD